MISALVCVQFATGLLCSVGNDGSVVCADTPEELQESLDGFAEAELEFGVSHEGPLRPAEEAIANSKLASHELASASTPSLNGAPYDERIMSAVADRDLARRSLALSVTAFPTSSGWTHAFLESRHTLQSLFALASNGLLPELGSEADTPLGALQTCFSDASAAMRADEPLLNLPCAAIRRFAGADAPRASELSSPAHNQGESERDTPCVCGNSSSAHAVLSRALQHEVGAAASVADLWHEYCTQLCATAASGSRGISPRILPPVPAVDNTLRRRLAHAHRQMQLVEAAAAGDATGADSADAATQASQPAAAGVQMASAPVATAPPSLFDAVEAAATGDGDADGDGAPAAGDAPASVQNARQPPPMPPANWLRREAVRRALLADWHAYRSTAWGRDGVRPRSLHGEGGLCDMAVGLTDSLDTLLLAGAWREFAEARDWIAGLTAFAHVPAANLNGGSSAAGSAGSRSGGFSGHRIASAAAELGPVNGLAPFAQDGGLAAQLRVAGQANVSLFECSIRVLGGLLSAYHVAGGGKANRPLLLKAQEIADAFIGSGAFATPTGLPWGTVTLPAAPTAPAATGPVPVPDTADAGLLQHGSEGMLHSEDDSSAEGDSDGPGTLETTAAGIASESAVGLAPSDEQSTTASELAPGGIVGIIKKLASALRTANAANSSDTASDASEGSGGEQVSIPSPYGSAGAAGGGSHAFNFEWSGGVSSLAEVGTLSLELLALSTATGAPRYASLAQLIERSLVGATPRDGLMPIGIDPRTGRLQDTRVTLGGHGDSANEYLLKTWLSLGGWAPFRRRVDQLAEAAVEIAFREMAAQTLRQLLLPVARDDHDEEADATESHGPAGEVQAALPAGLCDLLLWNDPSADATVAAIDDDAAAAGVSSSLGTEDEAALRRPQQRETSTVAVAPPPSWLRQLCHVASLSSRPPTAGLQLQQRVATQAAAPTPAGFGTALGAAAAANQLPTDIPAIYRSALTGDAFARLRSELGLLTHELATSQGLQPNVQLQVPPTPQPSSSGPSNSPEGTPVPATRAATGGQTAAISSKEPAAWPYSPGVLLASMPPVLQATGGVLPPSILNGNAYLLNAFTASVCGVAEELLLLPPGFDQAWPSDATSSTSDCRGATTEGSAADSSAKARVAAESDACVDPFDVLAPPPTVHRRQLSSPAAAATSRTEDDGGDDERHDDQHDDGQHASGDSEGGESGEAYWALLELEFSRHTMSAAKAAAQAAAEGEARPHAPRIGKQDHLACFWPGVLALGLMHDVGHPAIQAEREQRELADAISSHIDARLQRARLHATEWAHSTAADSSRDGGWTSIDSAAWFANMTAAPAASSSSTVDGRSSSIPSDDCGSAKILDEHGQVLGYDENVLDCIARTRAAGIGILPSHVAGSSTGNAAAAESLQHRLLERLHAIAGAAAAKWLVAAPQLAGLIGSKRTSVTIAALANGYPAEVSPDQPPLPALKAAAAVIKAQYEQQGNDADLAHLVLPMLHKRYVAELNSLLDKIVLLGYAAARSQAAAIDSASGSFTSSSEAGDAASLGVAAEKATSLDAVLQRAFRDRAAVQASMLAGVLPGPGSPFHVESALQAASAEPRDDEEDASESPQSLATPSSAPAPETSSPSSSSSPQPQQQQQQGWEPQGWRGFCDASISADAARARLRRIAEELTRTCVASYTRTATGVAPEIVKLIGPGSGSGRTAAKRDNVPIEYRSEHAEDLEWHQLEEAGTNMMTMHDARHSLLRPETAESLWLMQRLTGEQTYADAGWALFAALEAHSRVFSWTNKTQGEASGAASVDGESSAEAGGPGLHSGWSAFRRGLPGRLGIGAHAALRDVERMDDDNDNAAENGAAPAAAAANDGFAPVKKSDASAAAAAAPASTELNAHADAHARVAAASEESSRSVGGTGSAGVDSDRVPPEIVPTGAARAANQQDRLDSFVLAETWKYLYLLFSEAGASAVPEQQQRSQAAAYSAEVAAGTESSHGPDKRSMPRERNRRHHTGSYAHRAAGPGSPILDLRRWVFNTEAHPLPAVPDGATLAQHMHNAALKSAAASGRAQAQVQAQAQAYAPGQA